MTVPEQLASDYWRQRRNHGPNCPPKCPGFWHQGVREAWDALDEVTGE